MLRYYRWFLTGVLLLSALLLFAVQPMVARWLLPSFGGGATVWTTCMLFFQAVLLGGYAYAHVLSRVSSVRLQVLLHGGILSSSLFFLPLHLDTPSLVELQTRPTLTLLALLGAGVAIPFGILASTAPLMQAWLARSAGKEPVNPYTLYAASNLGSLGGLLLFPLWAEHSLRLHEQATYWSWGLGLYLLLVGVAGLIAFRMSRALEPQGSVILEPSTNSGRPTAREFLRWTALAALSSNLLLAVTHHLSLEAAPIPLLWVLPFALYLISYIWAFARDRVSGGSGPREVFAIVLIALLLSLELALTNLSFYRIGFHLFGFYVLALSCHKALAASKPEPRHLTLFYLTLSLGGVVGGGFNAILAPLLFNTNLEYPLGILLIAILLPRERIPPLTEWKRTEVWLASLIIGLSLQPGSPNVESEARLWMAGCTFALSGILLWVWPHRARVSLLLLSSLFGYLHLQQVGVIFEDRGFYSTLTVVEQDQTRLLMHGNTIHGAQAEGANRKIPLTYYHSSGPAGSLFQSLLQDAPPTRVGIVGLGVGSLSCYGRAHDDWVYYEIDPLVVQVAQDTSLFTFMSECEPRSRIVLGDARASLARTQTEDPYDLLVLDAFSSDAIPTHLLTREAFELYQKRLRPEGTLLFHISNRVFDFAPVIARHAQEMGLHAWISTHAPSPEERAHPFIFPSVWIVLRQNADAPPRSEGGPEWKALRPDEWAPLWTDQQTDARRLIQW